jgi:hypothetical protein
MADTTITRSEEPDGRVRYELGRSNWGAPVPDVRHPGSTVTVATARLIDVVILGDGFLDATEFESQLQEWIEGLFDLTVYDRFAGAFRIRALHEPSSQRASTARRSHYRCKLVDSGGGVSKDGWPNGTDADDDVFRQRLWSAVDSFDDLHLRRYSPAIDVGGSGAITNEHLRNTYRNLVVAMLVHTAGSANVSGMTRNVRRDPGQSTNGRVAFGAFAIHEFSHALGFLLDEYIDGRNGTNDRHNPDPPSVLTLINLTYSDLDTDVSWLHLAPTGSFPRTASLPEPSPLVGWLWAGGVVLNGAWHSEYRCLMNGTHDNFAFTRVEENDPTVGTDGVYHDETGATLRDRQRFCSWCQEIVAVKILEKTDQLTDPSDPSDPTHQGQVWYQRWISDLRPGYLATFAVANQIRDAETTFAAMSPGAHGEPLWRSDLYGVPRTANQQESVDARDLTDGETCILTYTTSP